MTSFADALLAAPVGVGLMARLEAEARSDVRWYESPADSEPDAVERAALDVQKMSVGRLMSMASDTGFVRVGPYIPEAPGNLAAAYRNAPARRAIAESIADRHGSELESSVGLEAQQWWSGGVRDDARVDQPVLFRNFDRVYPNGEFTDGLWSVGDPPDEVHGDLASAWELYPEPISRWHLPVNNSVRVWEVHRPDDWVRLVQQYPRAATRKHDGWELPDPWTSNRPDLDETRRSPKPLPSGRIRSQPTGGFGVINLDPARNQHRHDIEELLELPDQNGARAAVGQHLLPDWEEVAADFDGVHLSWAGFITSEGFVSDIGPGAVTMLRYWFSECTLWLRDVFGEPVPLGAPKQDGRVNTDFGVDVRRDIARQAHDRSTFNTLLAR